MSDRPNQPPDFHRDRQPEPNSEQYFQQRVKEKAIRKLRARQRGAYSIWQGVGAFGVVGWSVALPTMLGVAVGLWLDRVLETPISWTLLLLIVGLVIGCLNAWAWIQHEIGDRPPASNRDDPNHNALSRDGPNRNAPNHNGPNRNKQGRFK